MSETRVEIGTATLNRRGEVGARVHIFTESNGFHGAYAFQSHGKSLDAVTAERDRIIARHERKATRLADLANLIGSVHSGYVVTDATVRDVGATGCELLVRARGGRDRAEVRIPYDDPAHVLGANDVIALLQEAIAARNAQVDEIADHGRRLATALGIGA